jgi:hypothetical protein
MLPLQLPSSPVSERISIAGSAGHIAAGQTRTYADLTGPGCIRHIWTTPCRGDNMNRQAIIRIFFDGNEIPHVEAPIGDFFGVMHGKGWYPVNTPYLSIKAESGYNCYFAMPFAESARIEIEAGERGLPIYLMVDWHRYPDQVMTEKRRFRAVWRRECPTERYGEAYTMLDADGPGDLLGFVYGVRLIDNVDRWSHGGADNLYIDGQGRHPTYLRGIGGEDTFGTSYGGALHPPETHLQSGMPYYVHEDTGEARPAQRLVGYRFFDHDSIHFAESLHMRFGCMRNDICSTVYWYQEAPPRRFCRMPSWPHITHLQANVYAHATAAAFPRGTYDEPLPDSGSWLLCGPFDNREGQAMETALPPETEFEPTATYDGLHGPGSGWCSEGACERGLDRARWVRRDAVHGYVDFLHVFQPQVKGVGVSQPGVALARGVFTLPADTAATLRLAWDDTLEFRLNGEQVSAGNHPTFALAEFPIRLRAGANVLLLKLSNTIGLNHGGWAFACQCVLPDGTHLLPQAED